MSIEKELWGKLQDGTDVFLYTIRNRAGASVRLSSLGAAIVAIKVPDRDGKLEDVVLGYDVPASYLADFPCAGKIPGRYANRIAQGKFTLDGKEYTLPVNNAENTVLYEKYRALAETRPDVIFGGRLGQYKYYDMDKIVEKALEFTE